MKVLAFDPGFDRLGVAVIEQNNEGKQTLLYSSCIITNRKQTAEERLLQIGEEVSQVLIEYNPELVSLERLFFNKNVTTAIKVAEVRGVLIYLTMKSGVPVVEYTPQEVKVATTGYGKSDKAAVYAMVDRLIADVPEKALDDEYDAIAVGITALAHYRSGS